MCGEACFILEMVEDLVPGRSTLESGNRRKEGYGANKFAGLRVSIETAWRRLL